MANTPIQRRYSKDEFAKRGDDVFECKVRPQLTADDDGKFAAVDIESGLFEVDQNSLAACTRLRRTMPEAQIWLVRIGSPYVHRFGGREQRPSS